MHIKYTFEDATGRNNIDSVSFIESIELDYKGKSAALVVTTYNSMVDYDSYKTPICSETIIISDTNFDNYFTETELNKLDKNPLERGYDLLMVLTQEELSNRFDFKTSGTLVN